MCDKDKWEQIKAEYLEGGTSYRKLARKHGLSSSAIQRRAQDEGWKKLRDAVRVKTDAEVVELAAARNVDRFMLLYEMSDKFQERINELMDMGLKNGRDAHDMGDALLDAVQLIRELYDMPDEAQMQGRQRLELMRREQELRERQQQREEQADTDVERWVIEWPKE